MRTGMDIKQDRHYRLSIRDIALTGMMIAIMEVSKRALDFIPNVELITFWIILFTIYMGKKTIFSVLGFVMIEGMVYGFQTWWIMYLFIWPLLVVIAWMLRKNQSIFVWCIVSSLFGFLFGAICSIPYTVIGAVGGGIRNGLYAGFTWWVAGIPWDIVHGVANFIVMLVLYTPVKRILAILSKDRYIEN